MKKQIRKGTFETNSSSVHCISISKFLPEVYTGYGADFKCGEFGWEHRTYYGPEDKMSYLWTAIITNFTEWVEKPNGGYNRFVKTDDPEYIKIKNAIIEALEYVGFENDGWNIRFQEEPSGTLYNEYGYIDHCPNKEDFIYPIVFDRDRLLRYLFNDESCVSTGNDNDSSGENLDSCEDPEWEFIKGN